MKHALNFVEFYFSPENQEKLSPAAFVVGVAMAYAVKGEITLSQVSYKTINKLSGIRSNTTVAKAVKELKQKNFISHVSSYFGQYRPQVYFLVPKNDETKNRPEPARKNSVATSPKNTDLDELMKEIDEILGEDMKV